jgi:pyrroline-5-carboxylate reductase
MKEKTPGFVGAGRVARTILGGIKKAGRIPPKIVASDTDPELRLRK